jgi:4-diphosphocytidyl-2-C-methyl-D-erythritol kinase
MRVQREATYIRVETPAKLNLFFEVLGKRIDGFHEIETLMVPINLFDSLTFTPHFSGAFPPGAFWPPPAQSSRLPVVDEIALDCRWAGSANSKTALGTLPPAADNLAVRAAILLRRRAGVTAGATICLLKRIPSAAGLGGGSSDAAATLLAGNLAWRIDWPRERLVELAAELGSDVPFFLNGGAAICRGRGEQVESLARIDRLYAVVVHPPEGLSTAQVYARCTPGQPPRSVAPLVAALRRGDLGQVGRWIYNRLEQPAAEISAWIGRLGREFARLGCAGAQMSGSGTSYFGICHHALHARHVAGRLRALGIGRVYAVRG